MRHGDFTGLASSYSQYRPGYSESVASMILSLVDKPVSEIDFADVGAGTGIRTRMIAGRGVRSTVAVEPNEGMRAQGVADDSVNTGGVSRGVAVKDVRVQAGEEKFEAFLDFINEELKTVSEVEAHYQTRAWCARVK